MQWLDQLVNGTLSTPAALGVGVAVALVGLLVETKLYRLLGRVTASTPTHLDDLLVKRLRPAARALVLLVATHLTLALQGHTHPTLEKGLSVLEWLLVAYLVIEAAETLVFDWWFEEKRKFHVPEVLRQVILVGIYFAAGLSILGAQAGVNLAPILATGSVLTVVLGFALQDTLGNLFAGLALQAENAFSVGEWLLVDGVEGQVVNAGWRSTQLRTFTGDIVSIPNGAIAKARQQNFHRPEKATGRNVEFLVAVDAPPERVERACRNALLRAPLAIADHPRTKFWFVAMHPLYQRWILRCWVHDFASHDDMESDVLKALFHTLREEGIALPDATGQLGVDPDRPAAIALPVKASA